MQETTPVIKEMTLLYEELIRTNTTIYALANPNNVSGYYTFEETYGVPRAKKTMQIIYSPDKFSWFLKIYNERKKEVEVYNITH